MFFFLLAQNKISFHVQVLVEDKVCNGPSIYILFPTAVQVTKGVVEFEEVLGM